MLSTFPRFEPIRAVVFDGRSARPLPARLTPDPLGLAVETEGGERETVALDRLRRGSDGAGSRIVLHRTDRTDWRAISDAPLPAGWLAGIAPLHKPSRGKLAAGASATAALVAVVAGLWFYGGQLLAWSAPLVPHGVTAPVGRAVVAQIALGTRRCEGAEGRAALDRMIARLRPADGFVEPLTVTVIQNPAVNAFAAPGGQIAVFSGLIDEARSPDEVAGVLAHEIGHAQLRHPTKALIRQTGLGLAAQSIGGNVGGLADLAVLLRSTRGAEAEADAEAVRLMRAASVSPAGLAQFFARLEEDADASPREGRNDLLDRLADYAATHPSDDSRRDVMTRAAEAAGPTRPALDDREWRALRAICKG